MKHLYEDLAIYATEHDYYWLTETPSGNNQQIDKYLLGDKPYALYYNIIQTGSFETSDTSRYTTVNHTVEIALFQKDIKDDLGANYLPLIIDLMEKMVEIYNSLTVKYNFTSANYETGVDRLDATLAMCKLTVTYNEKITVC